MANHDSYSDQPISSGDQYSSQNAGFKPYSASGESAFLHRISPESSSLPYAKRPKQNPEMENHSHIQSGYDERDMRSYRLEVCQQPLHARMCGFGEKDRRPIDPPPIVQLFVQKRDADGNDLGPIDVQTLQNPFFVLHVTLWSAEMDEERNIISNPPKCTRVLMGSLVSSPSLLKNPQGQQGLYFAFPDLSIRTEGRYTLKFSLIKLTSNDFVTDAKANVIAQVFSEPFMVYSAKKFPGMTESTELSKAFARQGLKIPIRNDVRTRKAAD
ncbi:hypothetical protein K450DRAFT_223306 [Umbelopsis ramanniana AG]|uniref:Velvet domain-containing protein n=1 Tax=Umbelopsis ramanniana AG TaxID=1314678 RepID=A0AAD5EGF1_UMBRA|nr:uncharacterized protein K450DRAFT_223306 [Umbelopsis ramanniana AG]KAI8583371.1 hypothetical protein K450DRAFT_223306 [Umbelopsis ramanniana AG]